jgi:hypothetical protein
MRNSSAMATRVSFSGLKGRDVPIRANAADGYAHSTGNDWQLKTLASGQMMRPSAGPRRRLCKVPDGFAVRGP